jgi:protein lifeguard
MADYSGEPKYNNSNVYNGDMFADGVGTFSEARIRNGFIRKVYSLLTLQLLISFSIVMAIVFIGELKGFFYQNFWILWVIMIADLIIIFALTCFESVYRKSPLNAILLFIFTFLNSILIGIISSRYDTDVLMIAVGITAVIVISLTLFSFQTKIDFTGFGIYLFVALIVLILIGFVAMIFQVKFLHLIYSGLGALIFSFYIVYDTQLMLGGSLFYTNLLNLKY